MNPLSPPFPRLSPTAWTVILGVFLLARYAASPCTGFVLDDWNYLCLAQRTESYAELARVGFTKDLNRPLSTMLLSVGFRALGLSLAPYMLLLAASHLVLLALALRFAHRAFRGDATRTLVFGLGLAVLPILTETFYFPLLAFAMSGTGLPLMMLAAWGSLRFAGDGRFRHLAWACPAYGLSLFCYEAGLLLPFAFAALWWGRVPRRAAIAASLGFLAAMAFYLLWRTTDAFGFLLPTTPEHMRAGLPDATHLIANLKELLHWFAGRNLFTTLREGLLAYAAMPAASQILLGLANLLACAAVLWLPARAPAAPEAPESLSKTRLSLFAILWVGATLMPPLMGYVVSRLLLLPCIGLVFLAALHVPMDRGRLPARIGLAALFFSLMVDQGTNWSWREAGRANMAAYHLLAQSESEWGDKDLILFDSRRLRAQRPETAPGPAVFFHRNASLFRGSGLREMLWLVRRGEPYIHRRLDIEAGAIIGENEVLLRQRFDPEGPVIARYPLGQVHFLDLADALDLATRPDADDAIFRRIRSPYVP